MSTKNILGKKLTGGSVAFCLAIASVLVTSGGLATQASAEELSTGIIPATAPAPAPSVPKAWTIGPIDNTNQMLTTPADIQAYMASMPLFSTPSGGESMLSLPIPAAPTVLAGDDVTFIGGIWAIQGSGQLGPGGIYTAPPDGNWVPLSKFIEFEPNTGNLPLTTADIEFPLWPTNCAPGTPSVGISNPTTVWDGWCMGDPGIFQFTLKGITAPGPGERTGFYPYERWFNIVPNPVSVDPLADPLPASFGGPNNPRTGSISTTYGQVEVVDPKLQVIKEVCSTGVGCDPSLVTGDNLPVLDGTANTTGQWVDVAQLPVGTPNVQWRITATNTGNITLSDIHVAKDSWGYTLANDAGKVNASSCESLFFGTLLPGVSASLDCTTPVTSSLVGDVVNGVNLNGTLVHDPLIPGGLFLSPDGHNITDRLQGNPEGGSTGAGFVGSNTDIASASMPDPGIKLTKWVCEEGTGCLTPTGAVLTTLAGWTAGGGVVQGQPAGGWVKETTVKYGTAADWLIVVTNTGNTYFENVTLSQERTLDFGTNPIVQVDLPFSPLAVPVLAPGESKVFMATTPSVTNSNPYEIGDDGAPDVRTGEPMYKYGYDVVNIAQAKGTPTTDGKGTPVISAPTDFTTNESTAEVNVHLYAVGDYVWIDADQDGQQGPTEELIEGVVVRLLNDNGITLGTDTTDTDGHYLFENLIPGTYQIQFELPDGYLWTTPTTGGVAGNSDAIYASGNSDSVATSERFTLGEAEDNMFLPVHAVHGATGLAVSYTIVNRLINPTIDAGVFRVSPAISLVKWVCAAGTGCPRNLTKAELSDLTSGTPAAGWVKQTTVPMGTDAEWMILVANVGNVDLTDITLIREDLFAGGPDHGASTCMPIVTAETIPAKDGQTVYILPFFCVTTNITSTAAFGSGDDVVNTARAEGTPVDSGGNPIRDPQGNVVTVITDEDWAEVRTVVVVKDVFTGGSLLLLPNWASISGRALLLLVAIGIVVFASKREAVLR